jgi:transglutaminase-like putative cysteine protease
MTDLPRPGLRVRAPKLSKFAIPEKISAPIFLIFLTGLAGAFFRPVFQSWNYLAPPLFGVLLVALVCAYLADRIGISSGEGALIQCVAAVLTLPGLIALPKAKFGIPFPGAIAELFRALVKGPVNLLTSTIPARSGQELLVTPLVSAWLGFVIGWVLYRQRKHGWSLVGPSLVVMVALAFGQTNEDFRVRTSAGYLAACVLYVYFLGERSRSSLISTAKSALGPKGLAQRIGSVDQKRRLTSVGLLLVIVSVASGLGGVMPSLGRKDRFSLRAYRTPPFDPADLPSPLADFSRFLQPNMAKTLLFTATGTIPERWRLATLTSYDGRVWSVGSAQDAGTAGAKNSDGTSSSDLAGVYQPVGQELQNRKLFKGVATKSTEIQLLGLGEPWLPTPGPSLKFDPSGGSDLALQSVRYNEASDTLVSARVLPARTRYKIEWAVAKQVNETALVGQSTNVSPKGSLPPSPELEEVSRRAATIVGGTTGWDSVLKLKTALNNGFFEPTTAPGHAYGNLSKMLVSENTLIGNQEHYTALLALLTRVTGTQSRVVVGFTPKTQVGQKTQEVYGRDINAWVEVNVIGTGWVPVETKQTRTDKPKPEQLSPKTSEKKPPKPPVTVPKPEPEDIVADETKSIPPTPQNTASGFARTALIVGGAGLSPVLVLGALTGLVALLKSRRRAKRRGGSAHAAVSGAWEELIERAAEAGQPVTANMTVAEARSTLFLADPEMRRIIGDLSEVTEEAAFSSAGSSPEVAKKAWALVDQFRKELRSASTPWKRWKRLMKIRSLTQGSIDRAYIA